MNQRAVDVGDGDAKADRLAFHLGKERQVRIQKGAELVGEAAELAFCQGNVVWDVAQCDIEKAVRGRDFLI